MPSGFDFVDQLFSGFIAFVYNLVETAARMLVHPVKSPARLYRRSRDPKVRQVSGSTCLALSSALFIALLLPLIPRAKVAGIDFAALLPTAEGQVRLAGLVPFLIGGITTAIVADLVIRVGLAARARLRVASLSRAARASIAARLAYALSFTPLALSLYIVVARNIPLAWLGAPAPTGEDRAGLVLFLPYLLSPFAGRFIGEVGAHALVPPRGGWRRKTVGGIVAVTAAFTLIGGLTAGAFVASAIIARGAPRPAPAIDVVYRSCRLDGGTARAAIGLWTAAPRPQTAAPQRWRVAVVDVAGRVLTSVPFAPADPVVIEPGHLLRLATAAALGPAAARGTRCEVVDVAVP